MIEATASGYVASLPMYDWPEVRRETDTLWQTLADTFRDHGLDPPRRLLRRRRIDAVWQDPRLLLAQTCGLPYVRALRSAVRLIATPCYDVPGCDGPQYRSLVVARRGGRVRSLDDLRGKRVAYNASHSQSGYSALRGRLAPLVGGRRYFRGALRTGSHRASLKAVAGGRADVCAVDAVCWALARRHERAATSKLVVLEETPLTPGLPLIASGTRSAAEVRRIRAAVLEALNDRLDDRVRKALFLGGAEVLRPSDYDAIVEMEESAIEAGYPHLQ